MTITPETDFVFRSATEADRPFILKMNKETETWGDPSREVSDTFKEDEQRYVGQWTQDQGGVIVEEKDGGEEDGTPLGAAWLRTFTAAAPGTGYVADEYPEVAIAVAPGNTGKGLGRKLMQAVLDLAQTMGYPGVSLCVADGNDRAAHLYESIGYQHVGRDSSDEYAVMLYKFDS